ncbi:MAG: hypothetical protein QHG98_07265 [Methanothrix sp.]|jgi:hypothetical protein|nr:hypothetical protein [Methanothrix sp.]
MSQHELSPQRAAVVQMMRRLLSPRNGWECWRLRSQTEAQGKITVLLSRNGAFEPGPGQSLESVDRDEIEQCITTAKRVSLSAVATLRRPTVYDYGISRHVEFLEPEIGINVDDVDAADTMWVDAFIEHMEMRLYDEQCIRIVVDITWMS